MHYVKEVNCLNWNGWNKNMECKINKIKCETWKIKNLSNLVKDVNFVNYIFPLRLITKEP